MFRFAPSPCLFLLARFIMPLLIGAFLFLNSGFLSGESKVPERLHMASIPLVFEPSPRKNSDAEFVSRRNGVETQFSRSGIAFTFSEGGKKPATVALRLLKSNPDTLLSGEHELQSQSNYLIGSDPAKWRTHVRNFGRVKYSGVYPGIDLTFYGTLFDMEHDFVVAPGADPRQIAFDLQGARKTRIRKNGDLAIELDGATMTFKKPVAYQQTAAGRKMVPVAFVHSGKGIGFKLDAYDHTRELVIDPVLTFSTYLADLIMNYVAGVATDSAGNTYVAGLVFSPNYPTTPGAFQTTCDACAGANQYPDVFVTKLSADGTSQVYSTYLGGSNYDQAFGIAVDAKGNAIVVGRSQSTDFPVKNSVQHGPAAGISYGFIASLSSDGSSLNYSSLLGGAPQQGIGNTTVVDGVALDLQGNAYVTGTTDSPYSSATPGALNALTPAYPEFAIFVSKFLATGTPGSIAYAAIVGDASPQNGGGGLIGPSGIAVDSTGEAVITGDAGTLWPVTTGAYQTTIAGTAPYAAVFVSKLSADASHLMYSTFVGNNEGYSVGIALDSTGDAFITGSVTSPTPSGFPTTPNAYLKTLPQGFVCCTSFFSELDPTGSTLLYSSFFGTHGTTTSSHIAIDGTGNIWLGGLTSDTQFPLVNPIQTFLPTATFNSHTGFVSRFDPTGQTLTFSTYFGDLSGGNLASGTEVDGLAIDPLGKAHIGGFTGQALYTTPNAFKGSVTPPPQFVSGTYDYAAVIDAEVPSPALCTRSNFFAGDVLINTTQNAGSLVVKNCGNADLHISSIAVTASFGQMNNCIGTVPAGGSCQVTISFSPTVHGTITGTLTFNDDVQIGSQIIAVLGTGIQPTAQAYYSQLTFDSMLLGATSPVVTELILNHGDAPLVISSNTTTGDFNITPSSWCTAAPVQPGQACVIDLTFTPTAEGPRSGTLIVATNDPDHPSLTIPLSGTGWTTYPVPTITSIYPDYFQAGSSDTTVGVSGTGFTSTTTASLAGQALATTFVSTTQLNRSQQRASPRMGNHF